MRRTLLVALLASIASQATAAALDVEGDWLAGSRDGSIRGYVRISDCGDGTPCGILTDYDTSKTAQRRDARNPDPRLRPRSLVGVPVLWGFTRQGEFWRQGHLYNPEDGSTFNSNLKLDGRGRLRVTGCIGILCRTQVWSRSNRIKSTEGSRTSCGLI